MGFSKVAAMALGAVFTGTVGALCAPGPDGERGFVSFGGRTAQLDGHHQFCQREPEECSFRAPQALRVKLSEDTWAMLVRVNDRVNRRMTPMEDINLYGVKELWALPVDNKGDCEDYTLQKRRELIAAGWPEAALSIAMVHTAQGAGHAVLVAMTDQGDFVLDNLNRSIMNPHDTGYSFLKAVAPNNYNMWRRVTVRPAGPQTQSL
jgi:predicted transglutaminase-like cysteine proteinase